MRCEERRTNDYLEVPPSWRRAIEAAPTVVVPEVEPLNGPIPPHQEAETPSPELGGAREVRHGLPLDDLVVDGGRYVELVANRQRIDPCLEHVGCSHDCASRDGKDGHGRC